MAALNSLNASSLRPERSSTTPSTLCVTAERGGAVTAARAWRSASTRAFDCSAATAASREFFALEVRPSTAVWLGVFGRRAVFPWANAGATQSKPNTPIIIQSRRDAMFIELVLKDLRKLRRSEMSQRRRTKHFAPTELFLRSDCAPTINIHLLRRNNLPVPISSFF